MKINFGEFYWNLFDKLQYFVVVKIEKGRKQEKGMVSNK
jgi:hypothetical protein